MKLNYTLKEDGKYKFIEEGEGDVLLLLHGLFGALGNFADLLDYFCKQNRKVVIPMLPLYELPLLDMSVKNLGRFANEFVTHRKYDKVDVLGNSLGGHIALLFALEAPEKIRSITLTGSSGLFESAMGESYPKRKNYDYIKERTAYTFYDPIMATKELVDEVFEAVNNRAKAIRIIAVAKSAMKHNLADELPKIVAPTLLVWGKNDKITAPEVAEEFHRLIKNSELKFIDKCGHAPMMERPAEFNKMLEEFLNKLS